MRPLIALAILACVAAIIAAAASAEPGDDRAHEQADGDWPAVPAFPVFSGDVSIWGGLAGVHHGKDR